MTNRPLGLIIRDQDPLVLAQSESVQMACQRMWERRVGAVLVTDDEDRLVGIFTGRDAVHVLAESENAAAIPLAAAMTPHPLTIGPERTAIDALRIMNDRGFRHLPVVAEGRIAGIVSRGDFLGMELDRIEEENHIWERIG
jgi:CBS domain-containing protein